MPSSVKCHRGHPRVTRVLICYLSASPLSSMSPGSSGSRRSKGKGVVRDPLSPPLHAGKKRKVITQFSSSPPPLPTTEGDDSESDEENDEEEADEPVSFHDISFCLTPMPSASLTVCSLTPPTYFAKSPLHAKALYDPARFANRVAAAAFGRRVFLSFDGFVEAMEAKTSLNPHVLCCPVALGGTGISEVVLLTDPTIMFTLLCFVIHVLSARARELSGPLLSCPLLWRLGADLTVFHKIIQVHGSTNRDVAIFYSQEDIHTRPCANCQRGNSLFKLCVVPPLPDRRSSAPRPCCNCLWNFKRSSCSF
ncbi:hypothetical protein ACJ72_08531, partial [Emergomyces africanus]